MRRRVYRLPTSENGAILRQVCCVDCPIHTYHIHTYYIYYIIYCNIIIIIILLYYYYIIIIILYTYILNTYV